MQRVLVLVVVTACFTAIESKLSYGYDKDMRSNTVQPSLKLPENFRPAHIPGLQIPSKAFCEAQAMEPSGLYLVLPWWYQMCMNYLESKLKLYRNQKYYVPMYRRVLDQALQYKKYKQDLERKVLELHQIIN